MTDFQTYYRAFLGIDNNNSDKIIPNKRRDKLFSFWFKQILIMTRLNNIDYYSIAPQYYQKFKENFPHIKSNDLNEKMLEIDNVFCEFIERYSIGKYFRFSNPESYKVDKNLYERVINLDEKNKDLYFKLIGNRGIKFKEKHWKNREFLIKEKRYFIIIENNEIAAYSLLSDIDNGGANIVVVTLNKYRKKGYGKAVVSKSIEWCYNHSLLPIYLVNQTNIASIKLAKSLGFKLQSEEIIVDVM